MKNLFLFILTLVLCLGVMPIAYGDSIETTGEWGNKKYRMIVSSPPMLFQEGSTLSIHFEDSIQDLGVCVIDSAGNIVYENVISGSKNEVFDIILKEEGVDSYRIVLKHSIGWLVGEFRL